MFELYSLQLHQHGDAGVLSVLEINIVLIGAPETFDSLSNLTPL